MPIVLLSQRPDARNAARNELPLELLADVRTLESATGSTCQVRKLVDRASTTLGWVVSIDVPRPEPAAIVDVRIRPREPIAFFYAEPTARKAPVVYSDREDFPSDLPHLNPVRETDPCSLCVSKIGIPLIYEHGGIAAVLGATQNWLCDAARGQLERDGWEAMLVGDASEPIYLDIRKLQKALHELARKQQGQLHGSVEIRGQFDEGKCLGGVLLYHGGVAPLHVIRRRTFKKAEHDGKLNRVSFQLPLGVFTSARESICPERFPTERDAESRMWQIAGSAGVSDAVRSFLDEVGSKLTFHRTPRECVVGIGLWRPASLSVTGGMRADHTVSGSNLEVCLWKVDLNERGAVANVNPLAAHSAASPLELATMSGFAAAPVPVALIGNGALGSKISSYLVRSGHSKIRLIDKLDEVLKAHNLARHELDAESLGLPKNAQLHKALVRRSGLDADLVSKSLGYANCDVVSAKERVLAEALGNSAVRIIDATANAAVRSRLCAPNMVSPVCRVEIADSGRLGFIFVEGRGRSPRVDDLFVTLLSKGHELPAINEWLGRAGDVVDVAVGVGCSSPTFVLPDSTVALHAAAFMSRLHVVARSEPATDPETGSIGINELDDAGMPKGMRWVTVPRFNPQVAIPWQNSPRSTDWKVRLSADALAAIRSQTQACRPQEGGGYLYGRIDVPQRLVTIAAAIPVQALSSSPTSCQLPPATSSAAELEMLAGSRNAIACVGGWHSHPGGGIALSATDDRQATVIAAMASQFACPQVLLVDDGKDLGVHLVLPANWE